MDLGTSKEISARLRATQEDVARVQLDKIKVFNARNNMYCLTFSSLYVGLCHYAIQTLGHVYFA